MPIKFIFKAYANERLSIYAQEKYFHVKRKRICYHENPHLSDKQERKHSEIMQKEKTQP